jgi:hypothetical protein
MFLSLVLATSLAVLPPANGAHVYLSQDERYLALEIPPEVRSAPTATTRLVVFRDGRPVLDRGLLVERRDAPAGGTAPRPRAEGVDEDAILPEDARFALVLTTLYRRSEGEAEIVAATELEWIDPEHPAGRWRRPLGEGRWAKQVLPLSPTLGVAVITMQGLEGPCDLRIHDPDGEERLRLGDAEGNVLRADAASHGGFVAADLAYPDRASSPQRAILVLDLLRGTRWSYPWRYGTDDEPVGWTLDDSGLLEIRTTSDTRTFDRTGKALSLTRRR